MNSQTSAWAREFLETREAATMLCMGVAERYPFEDLPDEVAQLAKLWRWETCMHAIDIAFTHAESPIEKHFLLALLVTYVIGDPLGYKFTSPASDVRSDIAFLRESLATMRQVDEQCGAPVGSKSGFWAQAPDDEWRNRYVGYLGLGLSSAVHFTPQASFPDIGVQGRSVRLDLLAWIPDRPEFMLAVECDGYEWHSSREVFASDRARDRILKANGIDVLRIAGSEIHSDMAGVAGEVFRYINEQRSRR